MKAFWVLTKLQLLQAYSLNPLIQGKKWGKLLGFGVLGLYLIGIFAFVVYFFAEGIVRAFAALGALEAFPPLIAALVCVSTLVFSIYRASTMLFSARELEITLAMPVRLSAIVASRVMGLYLANLPFALMVTIPAIVPYIRAAQPGALFYPIFAVCTLAAPLVPVVLAAIVGALVAFASSRFRAAKYINMLLLVAVSLGAMYFSFTINANPEAMASLDLGAVGETLSRAISRIYPLSELYARAVARGDVLAFLGYVGVSALVFAAFAFALGRVFLPVCTSIHSQRRSARRYQLGAMKRSGVLKTLMLREWRHLTAVPMWIFNSLFGLLLALIGGVLLLINKNAVLAFMAQEFAPQLGVDLPLGAMLSMVLSWLVSMSCLTGCTISLEGRTLWQLKSLPVSGRDVFAAKVLLNILLCAPVSLAVGVLAGVAVGVSGALDWLWLLLTPCAYLVLIVLVGLLGNIRWHRYDWTNETVVIKQSLGAMLPVLVSMLTTLPVVYFLAVAEDANALMGAITLALVAIDLFLAALLRKKAGRWYASL